MLKPLADRVLIRLEAKEEKTKSGIFLPDTAKVAPSISNSLPAYFANITVSPTLTSGATR